MARKSIICKPTEAGASTGSSTKNLAKFSDTCSVRADGLCIGCLGKWAERGREDSNMHEFFCTTLYLLSSEDMSGQFDSI